MPLISDQTRPIIERRFLLFQVDVESAGLNSVIRPRSQDPFPKGDFRIGDPVDYDNPDSILYWRQLVEFGDFNGINGYTLEAKKAFTSFLKQFQEAVSDGSIKLKSNKSGLPYVDLSPFIRSVSDYGVRSDALDNRITIAVARPESTDAFASSEHAATAPGQAFKRVKPREINVAYSDASFFDINPKENDILVVKVSREGGPFELEFMGLVGKPDKGFVYGDLDSFNIHVFGLSKQYYTSSVASKKSLNPLEFLPGIDMNKSESPVPFSTAFNAKNVREIFTYLLEQHLMAKKQEGTGDGPALFRLDPVPFIDSKLGFQHDIFIALALFLMAVTPAPAGQDRLFPKKSAIASKLSSSINNEASEIDEFFGTDQPTLLDQPVLGVLERGDLDVYNKMVARGFENFSSQMSTASSIFGEIRSNVLCDVFESRDGITVVRPARFNKVEETHSEYERTSAAAGEAGKGPRVMKFDPASKVWGFNPDSEFVITAEEIVSLPILEKNDLAIETRVDVKPMFPWIGVLDYPAGLYLDPDGLFRYGLRSHGPVSNPNAYTPKLARLLAPLTLALINAPSRTFQLVAKDRKFYVGKLYYIESIKMMGFLVGDFITDAHSALSTRSLSFSMVRSVVERPISDILQSKNETLNVGMMFADDFGSSTGPFSEESDGSRYSDTPGGAFTVKDQMYVRGKRFLEALESASDGTAKILMFRYLPNIEDLIMEVESNKKLVDPPAGVSGSDNPRNQGDKRVKVDVDEAGFLYYTDGFVNHRFSYETSFVPALDKIYRDAFPEIQARAANQVPFETSLGSPELLPGILGYVYPSFPLSPVGNNTKRVSSWKERVNGTVENLEGAGAVDVVDEKQIFWRRSPFNAESISDPAQFVNLSQVLMDRLVEVDLGMKFGSSGGGKNMFVRWDGVPQFYGFNGYTFDIFGKSLLTTPQDYLDKLAADGFAYKATQILLNLSPADTNNLPMSCLGLEEKGLSGLFNKFLAIRPKNGGFYLPFGDIVIFNGGNVSFATARKSGSSTEGGRFSISKTATGEYQISAMDKDSVIYDWATGKQFGINTPYVKAGQKLRFISPFLEPTIERLFDVHIPAKYGGNLGVAEGKRQMGKVNTRLARTQTDRQFGMAINVCPGALFASSGSNIEILPDFSTRFEAAIATKFFGTPGRDFFSSNLSKTPGGLTVSHIYSDGSSDPDSSEDVYSFRVTDGDNQEYAKTLEPSAESTVPGGA